MKLRFQSGGLDVVIEGRSEEECFDRLAEYLKARGPEFLGALIRIGSPRRYRYISTVSILQRYGLVSEGGDAEGGRAEG